MESLRLNSITDAPRHEVMFHINEAFLKCGGGFIDFHMFSNNSFSVNFILPSRKVSRFHSLATEAGVRFTEESILLLEQYESAHEEAAGNENELSGTMQICFVHHDPDLRIEIPPIPG
jgi:hypothetical protein